MRPKIAVAVRDLRSGLFRRRELAHAIPAKHRRAGHRGFGIIENFDRYSKPVGLDLVPQRVAAAAAHQQQLFRPEAADVFQGLQMLRQLVA